MEQDRFLQLAGLHFIQSGGASAPREEACALPGAGFETDGTRPISTDRVGDVEVRT